VGDAYGSHDGGAAVLPAAIGPAFALISTRGGLERATSGFRERFGDWIAAWDDHREDLYGLIRDECEHATVTVWGPEGSVAAQAECLHGPTGERYLLLSARPGAAHEPRAGPESLIGPWLDGIPAIVWLKDLDGRYVHVNRAYSRALGIEPDEIAGRTDAEVGTSQAVDGPRLRNGGAGAQEPLEFEYTVSAFENRPALAALRFAVRDSSGAPVAVCGVAAPVADAAVARAECARLMQIERWSRLGDDSIRADVIAEWGLSAGGEPAPGSGESHAAAGPVAADPELAGELERVRAELVQVSGELEHAVAELEAARAAAAETDGLVAEERRRIESLHDASELAARRAHELLVDLDTERERREEGERELEQSRMRLGVLEAALADVRAQAAGVDDGLASELAGERERREHSERELGEERAGREQSERASSEERQRLGAELEAARAVTAELNGLLAEERHRMGAELDAARAAAADTERRAQELLTECDSLRERREQHARDLEHARGRVEELAWALGEERGRREELERVIGAERSRREKLERELGDERRRLDAEQERRQQHERDLERARTRLGELEAALAEDRAEAGGIEAGLARAEAQRVAAEQALAGERIRIAELESALSAGHERIAEIERTLVSERERSGAADAARAERAQAAVAAHRARAQRAEAALLTQRVGADQELGALREEVERERREAEALRARLADATAGLEAARQEADAARTVARREAEAAARRPGPVAAPEPAVAPDPAVHAEPPAALEAGEAVAELSWRPAAQHHLTATLTAASEWRTGLRNAVRIIGAEGGWDAATAWCPETRKAVLRCTAMWTRAGSDLGPFETLTWQKPQPLAGELGRALAGPHPTWLAGLEAADDARCASAAREGMRSALLVPIHHAGNPIGVLELLTRATRLPDAEIATSLEAVAAELGHFAHLMRLGAERHWRTRL
jgi:PAS domain-containing protein